MRSIGVRTRRLIDDNGLLIVLVTVLGAGLLLVSPALLVSDSWLALMAGREIVSHGLPAHDEVAVMTHGVRWTDQQWLAQLILYGEWVVGGLRLAVLTNAALVVVTLASAIAAARLRGGSARTVLFVSLPCLLAAPWAWQVRPQTFALPLFVWTLHVLSRDVRHRSRAGFVVFPLLVVWANLHGSVILGASVTSLAGIAGILRHRRLSPRHLAFVALPWVCVLASPYAWRLPAYYKLIFVDASLSRFVVEWQPARPGPLTAIFYVVALGAAAAVMTRRSRFNPFELAVLALTLGEAVLAIRGIVWFALAALVLVPSALAPERQDGSSLISSRRRIDRVLALSSVAALLASAAVVGTRPQGWFTRDWSGEAADAVRAQPSTARVFASDRLADWILWRVPSLRGRIAYDVRFELLQPSQVDPLLDFADQRGVRWARAASGYGIVVLDLRRHASRLARLRARPGTVVIYEAPRDVAVIRQPAGVPSPLPAGAALSAAAAPSGGSSPAAR